MSNNSRALNKKSMKDSKLSCVMFGQKHINSREGGIEVVVEELATRMVKKNLHVTCINRRGHHISGAEFDTQPLNEYKGIKILTVPTIKKRGLAALSSAFLHLSELLGVTTTSYISTLKDQHYFVGFLNWLEKE